jgi:hypothetical protein
LRVLRVLGIGTCGGVGYTSGALFGNKAFGQGDEGFVDLEGGFRTSLKKSVVFFLGIIFSLLVRNLTRRVVSVAFVA